VPGKHNEDVTTPAQTWTLLGIVATMATGMLAMVAFSYQSLRGYMDAKSEAVDARFNSVDERFNGVDQRFDAVDRRFDAVDRRLDNLDRDVQTLFRDRY
jgi:hypothetical protein